jgi:hypothetical protein
MPKPEFTFRYRLRNWPGYNRALVRFRGGVHRQRRPNQKSRNLLEITALSLVAAERYQRYFGLISARIPKVPHPS